MLNRSVRNGDPHPTIRLTEREPPDWSGSRAARYSEGLTQCLAVVKADQFWVLPNGAEHLPSVQADFDEMLSSVARPETRPA